MDPTEKDGRSRRKFLIQTVSIPSVAAISGTAALHTSENANAQAKSGASPQPLTETKKYQPLFFTKEEFEFIESAVARIIPKDELGAGALEAGVPEFIDRQLKTPYAVGANWYMQGPFQPDADPLLGYQNSLLPKDVYKLGIKEAEQFAKKQHGHSFSKLDAKQQDDLLKKMESGEASFTQLPSKLFFSTLLQNTREGFFSDPIHGGNRGLVGWKLINFPGARADFMDWVERGEKYPFPPVSIQGQRG